LLTLGGILLVALLLRVWSLRHGLPYIYNVDEDQHFASKAAALRQDGFDPGYFENPPGLTYLLWVVFAIRYAGRSLASLGEGNPTVIYLTAREIVAVVGTAVVGAAYLLGARLARDRYAGLVAAAVMAVGFVPVWYSKQALNDIPAVLPATLTLWLALRYADEGRRLGRLLYEGRWFDLQALMLRDALQRWVAAPVTGEVDIELRRGDDYTILDTRGESFSYGPERLSMERSATAFSAADRIGQLNVKINDVADARKMLERLGVEL